MNHLFKGDGLTCILARPPPFIKKIPCSVWDSRGRPAKTTSGRRTPSGARRRTLLGGSRLNYIPYRPSHSRGGFVDNLKTCPLCGDDLICRKWCALAYWACVNCHWDTCSSAARCGATAANASCSFKRIMDSPALITVDNIVR